MKQTIENLTKALVGESLASNLFAFYADIAEKEGKTDASQVLKTAAYGKTKNAKRLHDHLKELKGDLSDDLATMIIGKNIIGLGDTSENLNSVVASENRMYQELYPEYAKIATNEGLANIAKTFDEIAGVEKSNSAKFSELIK